MRLFVAVHLSEAQIDAILAHQRELKQIARANFSRPENLHLTLAFIGEYPSAEPVIAALETVEFPAYPLTLGGPGRFGDVRWVGVEDGGTTVRLAGEVRGTLAGAGIPFDPKPVRPHITVAREFRAPVPETAVRPVESTVAAFSLMRSDRADGKLVYTRLWEKKLKSFNLTIEQRQS